MTNFRPDRIETMMREYSKFGLDESQLKQLKSILQSGKVDVTRTNALITDAAYNDLQMGYGYIGKGSSKGITQSRNNLLKLISENSQSTPKVTPSSASPSPGPSSRSSALARANSRGDLVRQSAPTSTNTGNPASKGGGLTKNLGYQGGSGARPGGARVNIERGGIPTPGNPGGYGNPGATPKPNNVSANVSTPKPKPRFSLAKALPSLVRTGAQSIGLGLAEAIANSAGTKGASRMSLLGGDAPVYQTPLNDVKPDEVRSPSAYERLTGRSLNQSPASQRPKASGTVIEINGKRYDTGYHAAEIAALRKQYAGGGNAAQSQSIDSKAPAYIPLNTQNIEPPTPTPTDSGPKLDPNATEQFKTAFNAGNNNMAQIQEMYADGPEYKNTGKTALQLWAEANPALAQKEYLKKAFNTDGTPKILDKTAEGFDKPDAPGVVESINGTTLQNPIPINTLNEVLDKSEKAENAQEFLKNFIATGQYLTK